MAYTVGRIKNHQMIIKKGIRKSIPSMLMQKPIHPITYTQQYLEHFYHRRLYKHVQRTHLLIVSNLSSFGRDESAYHTKSQDHAAPEQDIVQQCTTLDPFASLQHDDGHLKHHGNKAVASEFSRDTAHDQFMGQRGDEKGDYYGQWPRHVVLGRTVNVSSKKLMHRNVPLGTV